MTLTDDQIRWASKVLWDSLQKNLKDTLVQQHLEEDQHPLRNAKQNWYYGFAEEEKAAYPLLRKIKFDGIPAPAGHQDRNDPPDGPDGAAGGRHEPGDVPGQHSRRIRATRG